jgi:16S rRNA (guanine527-N7)-methyltransferase
MLLEDALRAAEIVGRYSGPIVDVGSGAGTPGIPLAVALPDREVTLLDAELRKVQFLEQWASEVPNTRAVHGRAEEQTPELWGIAVAKALAPPPVAAEWCLPLVRVGGAAILWVGPGARVEDVSYVSAILGGGPAEEHGGLLVLPKLTPTPPGFPRRPGIARKRPLR